MSNMVFIVLAYAAAGILIVLLCLSTWWKARAIRRQLAPTDDQ